MNSPEKISFPSLSRELAGLWLETGQELLQPVKKDVFKHPKFGVVLPGLGRYAVRKHGLKDATRRVVMCAETLPKTRNFTVSKISLDYSNGSHVVGLQPTEEEAAALSIERGQFQREIGSKHTNNFNMLAILQTPSADYAALAADCLNRYFSHHIQAPQLSLGQATLAVRR